MRSGNMIIFILLIFFITLADSEKEKHVDKIVIHVPYKIYKHHHTHTKYKFVTIPAPKYENTVIYLKEHQLERKPKAQSQIQHLKESDFLSPHQQSAATMLQHLQNYRTKAEKSEELRLDQATNDQKSLETSNQNFSPKYEFQPMITSEHEDMLTQPQFLLNPYLLSQQQILTPKYVINPTFHHQHNFIPNFSYHTLFQPPLNSYIHKYMIKPNLQTKVSQDNVAHSSSHEHKMVLNRPKSEPYKVKEEITEDNKSQLIIHQNTTPKITVPLSKSNTRGNTYVHSKLKYNKRNKTKMLPTDPNYEYEHVGYLIIDGNSRKIVGKNFQDEIYLS